MDQDVERVSQNQGRRAAWLPRPMPLAMPTQVLQQRGAACSVKPDHQAVACRAALLGGTVLLTAAFAWQLTEALSFAHLRWAQLLFLVLSTTAFAWMALNSLSALIGCFVLGSGRVSGASLLPPGPLTTRVALLFPVYHEAPESIATTIEAIAKDLDNLGQARHFDAFVLSDSRSDAAFHHEVQQMSEVAARLSDRLPVFYRRRQANTGRKAGNISDWITRFGAGYDAFIVLDADSAMRGELLVRLARALEENPHAGLIQTVPKLIGGSTLFQQLQRFAAWTYGPSAAAGLACWYGAHGNYWGHNAIVRTAAFAASAGLPVLPGRPPFGGHFLSHDFVEAALLQRAGWHVLMAPVAEGSYEGSPPTMLEHVARDRRWAQGNLQHLSVLFAPGLTGMGRTHLALGAAAYIASAVWACSLAVGVLLALQSKFVLPSYFAQSRTLFPVWPISDPDAALRLAAGTLLLLFLPKFIGIAIGVMRASRGRMRLLAGAAIELAASVLLAPIMMVNQTRALVEILMRRDAGWRPQDRDVGSVSLSGALRFAVPHMTLGLVLTVACSLVSIEVVLWMSPVLLGMLLAGPLIYLTSQPPSPLLEKALAVQIGAEPSSRPMQCRQSESRHQRTRRAQSTAQGTADSSRHGR